jgi:hypothetical protein
MNCFVSLEGDNRVIRHLNVSLRLLACTTEGKTELGWSEILSLADNFYIHKDL